MSEKCKAELHIADDHGDNYATIVCQLEKDHEGRHVENFGDNTVLWSEDDRSE
jgi:hypothetical protein